MSSDFGGVTWTGKSRITPCGYVNDFLVDGRCCGQLFQFRQVNLGVFGVGWETVCPICDLKRRIMSTNLRPVRTRLCEELAAILSCDRASAYRIAADTFRGDETGIYTTWPVIANPEPAARERPARNVVPYRMPYAEEA